MDVVTARRDTVSFKEVSPRDALSGERNVVRTRRSVFMIILRVGPGPPEPGAGRPSGRGHGSLW
ncbi:hypothetical protein GCM10010349_21350 [Streptomyces flavofungini]|nr:hypothetical protein GCM10010349_21350 [Streptomyces flavofungini]